MILYALSVKIRGRQSACEPEALALHTLQGYIDCGGFTAICQQKQFFPGVCTFQPFKGLLCPLAEFRFQTYRRLPGNDSSPLAKMEDCLYSNESTKGFDDFSYSLFAFFRCFRTISAADGLASHRPRKQDAAQVSYAIPSPI